MHMDRKLSNKPTDGRTLWADLVERKIYCTHRHELHVHHLGRDTMANIGNSIDDCMNDIKMAGDDQWAKTALENFKAQCVQTFSMDTDLLPKDENVRNKQSNTTKRGFVRQFTRQSVRTSATLELKKKLALLFTR